MPTVPESTKSSLTLQDLLEPYARITCTYGSEGARATKCALATRQK